MEMIKLNINGRDIEAQKGSTILKASLEAGIYIPHLCHHPDLRPTGECGICIVEVQGTKDPVISCTAPTEPGMTVITKSEKIDNARKAAMERMLAGHPPECISCNKYLNCELQSVKQYLGVSEELSIERYVRPFPVNNDNPLFVHEPARCILCGRCVRACNELIGAEVLQFKEKNGIKYVGTADNRLLADSGCRFCGACAEVCPTGAIRDKEEIIKGKKRRTALVPCRFTCPAEIDVPRYLRLIREKNFSAATAVIREKVPFPKTLGYICDHPCEGVCRRGYVNQSVSIRDLKRYASEHDEKKIWEAAVSRNPDTGKRIAIIGSGPAGLTAAYYLSRQGHSVTVFEKLPVAGGMMAVGIPEYRLPREVLQSEIKDIQNSGIEIKSGTGVESIDKLFEEGYNAVLIAIGAHKGQVLRIPGADNENVFIGTEFLRDVNLGKQVKIGKNVLVLGGGNVAFDCGRVARRLGAEKINIACLECRTDMTASCDEIDQGEEEGICIYPSKTFTRILSENGRIAGVEFLDVQSFSFDDDKRLQIEVVENSHHVLSADTVIFAIGQRPEIPDGFGIETGQGHLITIDSYTSATNKEGVYAAGDAVTGTSSVIKAIASGRSSAVKIDQYLGGDGNIDQVLATPAENKTFLGLAPGFASLNRFEESCASSEDRILNFCKVVLDMDEDTAVNESKRCLQCDTRLKITPVKFWGDY
jgi:formate dehydrogenase (NADP+) beta subunit